MMYFPLEVNNVYIGRLNALKMYPTNKHCGFLNCICAFLYGELVIAIERRSYSTGVTRIMTEKSGSDTEHCPTLIEELQSQ